MGLSCGMSMVKYGLFIFNLVCAVSKAVKAVNKIDKRQSIGGTFELATIKSHPPSMNI